MDLTQAIVDWAKSKGYQQRAKALYETRRANEVFTNPNTGHQQVFAQIVGIGKVCFLTHELVAKHVK